jgi:thiol-disulfide isomerase/thioredoxin
MTRLRAVLLSCLLISPIVADDKAAETYRVLTEEFDEAMVGFRKAFEGAKTPADKKKVLDTLQPRAEDFAPRFMSLARLHAESPAAVDSLFWVVTHPVGPASPRAALRGKALESLSSDHIKDKRLGKLCTQLVHSADAASEKFLREVYAKGSTAGVKARACASLAHNLKFRARLVRALKDDTDAVKDYERSLGKAVVARLQKTDPKALLQESEELFTLVAEKYGDMAHPLHGTMKELARWHLYSIRRPITLDKPSPNILGEDVAGKKMALRDFAGKVVLLDFSASYFPPCRQMLGYERGLVARLDGKPFALVGVNGDGDRAALQKYLEAEKVTWRMWYDGGGTGGPIATRWEVDSWPTLVLIDSKGVIRSIYEGWPETKTLDAEIDKLVGEAAKAK